jgi:hypothetical protein
MGSQYVIGPWHMWTKIGIADYSTSDLTIASVNLISDINKNVWNNVDM